MSSGNENHKWFQKLDERLDGIDKTLVKQEENLKHHMYRTELAEKRLEHIETDMSPLKDHVKLIHSLGRFLGWLIGSGAIIALLEYLKN